MTVTVPEVLGEDVAPGFERRRVLLRVVAAVLAVLVAGAWFGTQWWGARQTAQLVAAATDAREATDYANAGIVGMVRYAAPVTYRGGVVSDPRALVAELVSTSAGIARPQLVEARARLLAVEAAPWQADLTAARDEYVAYLDAWIAFLDRLRSDVDVLWQPQPQLTDAGQRADRALRAVTATVAAR